jgi:hypothetical protein
MKIVMHNDKPSSFLNSVGKILSVTGHEIVLWNSNQRSFYEMQQQIKPELIFIHGDINIKYWDLVTNIPYVVYDGIDIGGRSLANIPSVNPFKLSFADTLTYRGGFEDGDLGVDILISSNYFYGDTNLLLFADKIMIETELSVRAIGNQTMPSPVYIGGCTEEQFISSAKSAKVVLTGDPIERDSLIYNKIFSCTIHEGLDRIQDMVKEEKLRRKTIKELRKAMVDGKKNSATVTMKLLKLINMPSEAEKVEQILGNIL